MVQQAKELIVIFDLPVPRRKCCSLVCSSFTLELLSPAQISWVARLRRWLLAAARRRRLLLSALCVDLVCKELAELFNGLETIAMLWCINRTV